MKLNDTTLAILALWLKPGLGPAKIQRLLNAVSDISTIFDCSLRSLTDILEGDQQLAELIPQANESPELEQELELISKYDIEILDITRDNYPSLLKEIYNPPPVLYKKGNLDLGTEFNLAFVGSRKASYSGKNSCRRLIKDLAVKQPGTTIISGLALGIDTSAHEAALEFGLKTVGVLANGLTTVYPSRNRKLASKIIQNGALITEFPMTVKPVARNFPLRNRIISGLSRGIVVVEAGERSGASITAGYALEQNRELFALPGPVDSTFYKGTNRLIQRGQAKLVMEINDILEEFELVNQQLSYQTKNDSSEEPDQSLDKTEKLVLAMLEEGICQKDLMIANASLPVSDVLPALVSLEVKGYIVSKPGARYEFVNRNGGGEG